MYTSIQVHIENGQVVLDEPLQANDHAKGILTIIEEEILEEKGLDPNGKKLAVILSSIAKSNHHFLQIDPIAWQKEMRTDNKLTGRDEIDLR